MRKRTQREIKSAQLTETLRLRSGATAAVCEACSRSHTKLYRRLGMFVNGKLKFLVLRDLQRRTRSLIDSPHPAAYIYPMRTKGKQRFAVRAEVLVKMPGVTGTVVQVDDEPTSLGEYWHLVRTEHGERKEPGCNLELVPRPKTNLEPTGSTRIHIEHMENSAFIHSSPGASISQMFDISSQEFRNSVQNFRELMGAANLTDAQRSEANSEFTAIEVELESPSPQTSVVRPSLQSLRTILENATGSLIGSAAYATLVHYILHLKP